jgi:hypothetical protein
MILDAVIIPVFAYDFYPHGPWVSAILLARDVAEKSGETKQKCGGACFRRILLISNQ